MKKNSLIMLIITLICIIVIILYLLILNMGYIRNNKTFKPTGNVDIFEINCNCDNDNEDNVCESNDETNDKPVFKEENIETDKNKPDIKDLIVSDNYSMWGNKQVRIFSNPSYEYTAKIAPGSFNSYTFVIKNNNDFDVVVDFEIVEDNPHKVNMNYKLSSKGNYLAGNESNYVGISELQIKNIKIKAHESIPYILDWKWIDSENDTQIGEQLDAKYKLTINIGANGAY